MSMTTVPEIGTLEDVLLSSVKKYVSQKANEIMAAKILEVRQEIEKAVADSVARMALQVSSMTSFQNLGHKIVIEIDNRGADRR